MVTDSNILALRQLNIETLQRLKSVLGTISQPLYTHVNIKGRASVGQHVRHTLEFYQCLFDAHESVNYDSRQRNIVIESSANEAMAVIDKMVASLNDIHADASLKSVGEFPSVSADPIIVASTLSRELLYVLEHAIHHMAIIRILIKDEQPNFELEEAFGVAYSTLAYRDQEAQD